jgi:hypothetical protein
MASSIGSSPAPTASPPLPSLGAVDVHVDIIRRFYGDRKARRSGVPFIAHIDDGLNILVALDASIAAQQAFCLHPILQADDDFAVAFTGPLRGVAVDPQALALAVEYRRCANGHLSTHPPASLASLSLAPFVEIEHMLIADKVQNRRDFDRHHRDHPRAVELTAYFHRWLEKLGVNEARYLELVEVIGGM